MNLHRCKCNLALDGNVGDHVIWVVIISHVNHHERIIARYSIVDRRNETFVLKLSRIDFSTRLNFKFHLFCGAEQ